MYNDYEPNGGSPAEMYKFVQGANTWRWTSSDESVTTDDGEFSPQLIRRGNITANAEARTQSVDVVVEAENEVAQIFSRSTPDSPVFLTIFRTHLEDPDAEVVTVFTGQVKNCTFTTRTGTLHCVPMQDVVERNLVQLVYQPTCNNALGDVRCGVDMAAFTFDFDVEDIVPVSSGATAYTLDDSALTEFYDFYGLREKLLQGGVAIFGTQKVSIIYHSVKTIWVLASLRDVVVGSTITVKAGCPKTALACSEIFDNIERFQGFPNIPQKNPFVGRGLE